MCSGKNGNFTHNKNAPVKPPICRFDYPLPINDTGTCMEVSEYILEYEEEENPTFGYELLINSLRNDRWLTSHM